MSALREVAAAFGITFDTKALERGTRSIDDTIVSVIKLGSAIAGSSVVREIAQFSSRFAAMAHEVRANAAELRVSTNQLQEVETGLRLAGLSAHESTAAFARFHQNVRAAATGGGDAGGAFYRLGIRLRDNDRQVRNSSDVLADVAARFDRIQNPARRAHLATQLFGAAGLQLLPALHAGAGGLAELRREFELLGGGVTPQAIETARQYENALTRWRVVSDGVRSQVAIGLLPALTWLVDRTRGLSRWFLSLLQHTHGVRNALYVLGTVGAAAGAMLLAPWLPAIATFTGIATAATILYLVIDDLITLAEGGHSVIGMFLDRWFGPGTADALARHLRMITSLREAYDGIKLALSDIWSAMRLQTPAHWQSPGDRAAAEDARTRASFRRTEADRRARADDARAMQSNLQQLSPRAQAILGRATTVMGTITAATTAPAVASMPAARSHTTVVQRTDQRTLAPVFHISGPDANRVADVAVQRMRQMLRDENDAGHPLQPRDE